jgi:hypothetical protein
MVWREDGRLLIVMAGMLACLSGQFSRSNVFDVDVVLWRENAGCCVATSCRVENLLFEHDCGPVPVSCTLVFAE